MNDDDGLVPLSDFIFEDTGPEQVLIQTNAQNKPCLDVKLQNLSYPNYSMLCVA